MCVREARGGGPEFRFSEKEEEREGERRVLLLLLLTCRSPDSRRIAAYSGMLRKLTSSSDANCSFAVTALSQADSVGDEGGGVLLSWVEC